MDYAKIDKGIEKYRGLGKTDEEINSFLKSKGVYSPTLNKINTQYQAKGLLGKTAEFLGAPSRALVERGQAFLGFNQGALNSVDSAYQKLDPAIAQTQQLIQKGQRLGKDTSNLEGMLNQLTYQKGELEANRQNLQSGGVTNKQVAASAFQTGLSFLPSATGALGKVLPGRAGQALSGIDKMSQTNPFKYLATEGAIAGAGFGGSEAYGQGGDIADIALGTVGGGIYGAIGGPVLAGGVKYGILKPLEKLGANKLSNVFRRAPTEEQIWEQTNKAFGFGNLSDSQAIKAMNPTDIRNSPRWRAVEGMYNSSDDVVIYDKKGKLVKFDPTKGKESDYFQALKQSEDTAYGETTSILSELGNKGWNQSQDSLATRLLEIANEPGYGEEARNMIAKEIVEILSKNSPAELEAYLANTVSLKANKYFGDNAVDSIQNGIAARVRKEARDIIFKYAEANTGSPQVKALMNELAAYKNIEDNIVALFKNSKDPNLAEFFNKYGFSQMISGGMFQNPAQFAKGGAFNVLGFMDQLMGSTELAEIRKAFKLMDDFYKSKGLPKGRAKVDLNKIKESVNSIQNPPRGLIPVGEVVPKSGMQMPGPKAKIMDEAGIPKSPIRQAEESLGIPKLGEPGTGPFGYKSGEAIPVAPNAQVGKFDITAPQGITPDEDIVQIIQQRLKELSPEQKSQLLEQLTSQKKNSGLNDKLGGAAAFAPLATIFGLTKKVSDIKPKPEVTQETEVSLAEVESKPVNKTSDEYSSKLKDAQTKTEKKYGIRFPKGFLDAVFAQESSRKFIDKKNLRLGMGLTDAAMKELGKEALPNTNLANVFQNASNFLAKKATHITETGEKIDLTKEPVKWYVQKYVGLFPGEKRKIGGKEITYEQLYNIFKDVLAQYQ